MEALLNTDSPRPVAIGMSRLTPLDCAFTGRSAYLEEMGGASRSGNDPSDVLQPPPKGKTTQRND